MEKKEIIEVLKNIGNNNKLEPRVIDIIINFVIRIKEIYGDKYISRIIKRLEELKEIKYNYNNSKYTASSKRDYIIFFKKIDNKDEYRYILEHELFHFIQKEDSAFEKLPQCYKNIRIPEINILLLEESFVQYFMAVIENKSKEYIEKKEDRVYKYWMNSYYKEIVGYVEHLEKRIGRRNLFDMYMDDSKYEKEIKKYDNKYGNKAFLKEIIRICM